LEEIDVFVENLTKFVKHRFGHRQLRFSPSQVN